MYFGSVKFFKHVIVATVLLLITGLAVCTVYLYKENKGSLQRIGLLESEVIAVQASMEELSENVFIQQSEALDYQSMFPEMVCSLSDTYKEDKKTVYLTFDDGPSARTVEILDILKEYDIKATFFIVGKNGEKGKPILKRIVDEGHTIAIHTYSHVYEKIYESVENYLTDFNKTYDLIYETTGVKPEIFRFPGGSVNKYNASIHREITSELTRRGFTYYDWNASNGDAASNVTRNSVLINTINSAGNKNRVILLMHDSEHKYHTVSALKDVIEHFKEKGYRFDKITKDVKPVAFNYND